ncbi:hypothetical protein NEIRO03_2033 [Nematocida sp. AWRm78]|nr:hypothetical protein NEIRO02_2009 [Nematocida sp. AWRm79]KAI5185445.1 hypothetical protein NEIRO03_2033 [Nematocida sp. AWRm78]
MKSQGVNKQKAQNNNGYLRLNASMHANEQCIGNGIDNKFKTDPKFDDGIEQDSDIHSEDSVSETPEIRGILDYLRFMYNRRICIIPIIFSWFIIMYLANIFTLLGDNLTLMNNPNLAESKNVLSIFKNSSSTTKQFLTAFVVFFFVNTMYAVCRVIKQFNAMFPMTPYAKVNNRKIQFVIHFIGCCMLALAPVLLGEFLSSKYSASLPISLIIYIFAELHSIYVMGEILYYIKTSSSKYYILKPNTKKMSVALHIIYYINHVILMAILLTVACNPDVLVPLAVIDRVY